MKNNLLFLFALTSVFIAGCSGYKPGANTKDSLSINDTSFLDDKNYAYKNLTNTLKAKFVYRQFQSNPENNGVYKDSTYKIAYVALNDVQKKLLIVPFLTKELKMKANYVLKFMGAFFVSKQDKIGMFRPIIVNIGGDDYNSITMIILDENNKPISGFNIAGGRDFSPTEIGDSLIMYEAKSYSYLKKNTITTYRIKQTDRTDKTNKTVAIDTAIFVSAIDKSGKITTTKSN